ncbi:MAG: nucleotide sugar dehydrogenase, partial [Pseudomonadota bacterium]
MKISIFGMGYVGVVSTACLLRDGHTVTGVDPVQSKIDDLSFGRTPISEPQVADLLAAGHRNGNLLATTNSNEALDNCDMVWICVGTPSGQDGSVDLAAVQTCVQQIGDTLRRGAKSPLIVLRSTVLPGSCETQVIPTIEKASGLTVGKGLDLVFHPEFLREGSAVADFVNPPKIVVGESRKEAADLLLSIYEKYTAPRFRLKLAEAELVKYCDNVFHALKVCFANEIGVLAKSVGVDGRKIADVFCSDTKLNISPRYLRPGFAFGGSCLPKDLRAITRYASSNSLQIPLLSAITSSNSQQIDSLVFRLLQHGPRNVGMIGLAFKPDTDDMRESPYVTVAKRLIGEGISLRIYDPGVDPKRLIGANKKAVQSALRHLEALLVPSLESLDKSDLIVINHPIVDTKHVKNWLSNGIRIVDLVG